VGVGSSFLGPRSGAGAFVVPGIRSRPARMAPWSASRGRGPAAVLPSCLPRAGQQG
jgi:hypothetical protein